MSWYGTGYGEVDISAYERIVEQRHPRRKGESRDEWWERIQPELEANRVHKREPGKLVRSAGAVTAQRMDDAEAR